MGILAAGITASGCSIIALGDSNCTADDQCIALFGAGAQCGGDGFCRAAPDSDASPSGADGAGGGDGDAAAMPSEPSFLPLADVCDSADVPAISFGEEEIVRRYNVDTSQMNDDIRTPNCSNAVYGGNEGFFSLAMGAGERWHLFAAPSGDSDRDVAMYLLNACDSGSCIQAIDSCGAGGEEHFTLISEANSAPIVAVDSRGSGGSPGTVVMLRPICGNSALEHSETCDDGNVEAGDGCDQLCRREFAATDLDEIEYNDEIYSANVVLDAVSAGGHTVAGLLSGRCDFDVFAVNVAAGASVRAVMTTAAGDPCDGELSYLDMELIDPAGRVLGNGSADAGNACPEIDSADAFAQDISVGGMYYVRLGTGRDPQDNFGYQLKLEVVGP